MIILDVKNAIMTSVMFAIRIQRGKKNIKKTLRNAKIVKLICIFVIIENFNVIYIIKWKNHSLFVKFVAIMYAKYAIETTKFILIDYNFCLL